MTFDLCTLKTVSPMPTHVTNVVGIPLIYVKRYCVTREIC